MVLLLLLLFILSLLDNVVATKDQRHFGTGDGTKTDEFLEKFQRGGGVFFNPKIYAASFGPLNLDCFRKFTRP